MKEEYLLIRYKWEFIRRNPEYIRAYNHFVSISKSRKYVKTEPGVYKDIKTGKFAVIIDTPIDWPLLKVYLNPQNNFEFYQRKTKNIYKYFQNDQVIIEMISWGEEYQGILEGLGMPLAEEYLQDQTMSGKIWLNLASPKSILVSQFKILLDGFIKKYKIKRSKIEIQRVRYNDYDQYLKAYDLKQKGTDWEEMAQEVYPNVEDRAYARRKVKRDYQRSLKFIEYAFRQIR